MAGAHEDIGGKACGSTAYEASDPPPVRSFLRGALHCMTKRKAMIAPLLATTVFSASVVVAQVNSDSEADLDPADWTEKETGIPVTDKLTIEKCGTCHAPDDKGNLSRISWIRATPEGWSQAIKRMVKLNGLSISPQEARGVVKYLGTWHGLSPEEAKPVMYLTERRILDETIIPNQAVQHGCASCHAFAQPMSSRRSRREWGLLQNLLVYKLISITHFYIRSFSICTYGVPIPSFFSHNFPLSYFFRVSLFIAFTIFIWCT